MSHITPYDAGYAAWQFLDPVGAPVVGPAAATMNGGNGVVYAWGKVGAAAAPPANGGGSSTPPPPAYASPDTIASAVHLARVSPKLLQVD